jgi:hypothetical protein
MTTAVPKLAAALTRSLFTADLDRHWSSFEAYSVEQAVLSRPVSPHGDAAPPHPPSSRLA